MSTAQMVEQFQKLTQDAQNLSLLPPAPRTDWQGRVLQMEFVFQDPDVVYHINAKRFPTGFRDLLAEVIEAHFGSTESFAVDYVPEMSSYALIGRGLLARPIVDRDHLTTHFARLLDAAVHVLRTSPEAT